MIGDGPASTDLADEFRTLSASASFNQWAGFDVVRVVPGECDLRLAWRDEDMGQYAGFLHAGLIAALLDTACGFAAAAIVGSVLSSHFSGNCLAPAVGDQFVALGRVVKAGRRQVVTSGELHARRDGASKLVAMATSYPDPDRSAHRSPRTERAGAMKVGTSLRFLFPAGPQTAGIYQSIVAALPPGAFTDRPMGAEDVVQQADNLVEVARAARASNLWGLLVGDNHAIPSQYANLFQPVPTIARLSAETGPMMVGMVLLAPFYHPLLLAEQIGTLSAFVDAPIVVTFASGGSAHAFEAFGYRLASRGTRSEAMIPAVRALLAGEAVTVTGRSFELAGATISPLPRRPTEIWIAGTNDITVERAGRLGDGWLTAQNATDSKLVEQLELYRRTADAHGRPCRAVLRRDVHVAATDAEARGHVDPILAQGYRGVDYDRLLVGSPETVVGRLRHYESMGFDHVMVRHITGDHDAMIRSFELLGEVVAAVA